MEIQIEQIEGVKLSVHARAHRIVCDQPMESGGTDAGMTPPELLLASLGACAAFYAAEYLRTRNLAKNRVTVSVAADKIKDPARLGNFRMRIGSPAILSPEQRQGLMRSVNHCLVKNTLLNPPQIEISFDISHSLEAAI